MDQSSNPTSAMGLEVIDVETPGGSTVTCQKEYTPILSFTPRQYQLELLETALEQNTTVCLQSGTEKTFLAVMLIKELSGSVRKSLMDQGKRTIFLVNSESCLSKYGNVIRIHTDLKVREYRNGEDTISWDQTRWQEEIEHCHVAVMDSEIFLKLLQMSYVGLSMVNLLILDECHHTLHHLHPYHQVMMEFQRCPRDDRPRVLGLTESILNGEYEPCALENHIDMLEISLQSTAKIATNLTSVSKYGTKPKEAVIVCRKYEDCVELVSKLSKLLTDALDQLDQFEYSFKARDFDGELMDCKRDPVLPARQALTECLSALTTIGPLGVRILIPMLVREILKLEKHEFLDVHLLFLQHATTQLRMVERICDNALKEGGNFYNLKFLTPRVRRLLEVLAGFKPKEVSAEDKAQQSNNRERTNKYASRRKAHRSHKDTKNPRWRPIVPENQDEDEVSDEEEEEEEEEDDDAGVQQTGRSTTNLCGIIFVEQRYTAAVMSRLFKKLSRVDPRLHFLLCSCIAIGSGRLGVAKKSPVQVQNQRRKHEEVLRKFRRREVNVLVATSSVEDGVELPRCNGCNLVVRFDRPTSYQSYMQSKAKARAPTSHYLLLIDEPDIQPFLRDVQIYQEFERVLNRKSKGKNESQQEEVVDLLIADRQMSPYMTKNEEGSPRASMTTAIQIINRYCAKLPSDVFTHLTASCKMKKRENDISPEFQATLQLPINSPIREPITGPWMKRKKWATMAVAVQAAEILHKAGELNDYLQPMGKESVLKGTDNAFNHLFADGQTRPGTTKKRQYYDKEVAMCLKECLPIPDQPCYLYSIEMNLASPLPDILNIRERRLHRPEETQQCFGIITSKQLPRVPGFPVYTRAGELSVSIKLESDEMRLSSTQIRKAQSFHGCMFSEVLRLDKPNLELNPEKSEANYLIVPLKEGPPDDPSLIDWSFLEQVSLSSGHLDQPPQLPDYSQSQFEFSTDILADAVVTPIYRNIDQPQRYFVADILYDLPVTSSFPSEKYDTFVDYYFERYDIQISNFQQPLVDVDCMSSRLNLLTPRYLNHKGKALPISTGQNKKGNLQKKQYLVPELCYIYPIHASLWRKAVCLPSILYRLNALLIAEELRVQVSKEAGIGLRTLPQDYPYPNLSFGWEGLDIEALERQEAEEASRCEEKENAIHVQPQCNNIEQLKEKEAATDLELTTNGSKDNKVNEQQKSPCTSNRGEHARGDINVNSTTGSKEIFDEVSFHLDDDGNNPQMCLGPSPTIILQSLTMSNSSDGFNLERLEMLGDSFLKQAVTVYLYCMYPHLDEGKLSFLRSKQVSNFNLYCLGDKKSLAQKMQVSLFDPSINWLPPCLLVKESSKPIVKEQTETDADAGFVIDTWDPSTVEGLDDFDDDDFDSDQGWGENSDDFSDEEIDETKAECPDDFFAREEKDDEQWSFSVGDPDDVPGLTYTGAAKAQDAGSVPLLPYEIHTQHSMSDKSIADCVEALIGCYLVSCGFRSALLLMAWMGLDVLPSIKGQSKERRDKSTDRPPDPSADLPVSCLYGYLKQPKSPLLTSMPCAEEILQQQLVGYQGFEKTINYRFKDRAYLLQAFTHSSYHRNSITDCYQRLEFLGDALLDYLITRHLYDHHTNLSPGALTDLRSALVNNTIFASLAVKFNFHKYFKAYTANMFQVIDKFVTFVNAKNEALGMDSQLKYSEMDGDQEESEDIEVPKALGDIFESVAGAIYLDSGMSLNAVWKVYYPMMKQQIEQYASDLPISPVRELLEMEPETARFGPPEKTIDGKTRVTVSVVGKGQFKGIGRNYHIAKATAARFALRHLKSQPKM